MIRKSLYNQLELAYAPITAYVFAMVREDPLIEKALEKASLYAIGQRAVITFENIHPDQYEYQLNFEIHQKGNSEILKCKLPLIQEAVGSTDKDTIAVGFNFLDKSVQQSTFPLHNIHGLSLAQEIDGERKFLIWFSPEKLLQNWWTGSIRCDIEGDYQSFTNYKIHYVGKATRQSILKRLTGHSTFQDILSMETPVTPKQLPANEIVILPFEFQDNIKVQVLGDDFLGDETKIGDLVETLRGDDQPEQEKIFLDAEKALINAMKPSYNKELFHNYPVSKDGLYNDKYDAISYTFIDPITLIYNQGQIVGGPSITDSDVIQILDNEESRLVKRKRI